MMEPPFETAFAESQRIHRDSVVWFAVVLHGVQRSSRTSRLGRVRLDDEFRFRIQDMTLMMDSRSGLRYSEMRQRIRRADRAPAGGTRDTMSWVRGPVRVPLRGWGRTGRIGSLPLPSLLVAFERVRTFLSEAA